MPARPFEAANRADDLIPPNKMSAETTPPLAGRRIGIDLKGGESISFRCHGEPTPAFLEAMKALGEAAADYVNSGGLQNDSTQQTNEH